jgi:hypothetical protein
MLAASDILLEQHANLLRQGAVFVDPTDDGNDAHLLFLLTHEVKSGDNIVLSRRLQFVRVAPDGSSSFAGWAPHLDLEPLANSDRGLMADVLDASWVRGDQEQKAVALAASTLVPEHYMEVATRRIAHVDKTLAAVHERLTKEIGYWQDRWMRLKDDVDAGKDVRLNLDNARRTIADLESRLENRRSDLKAMRHVVNGTPVVLGAALVVPEGLLRQRRGETPSAATSAADALARARIERLAMDAVRQVEEARGCRVVDVSMQKCGWDITSYPPTINGVQPDPRHIEVKGRVQGADTVTVSYNEVVYACNQGDKFILAISVVGDHDVVDGPYYLRTPFDREPGWGVSSVNYNLRDLLSRAQLQKA